MSSQTIEQPATSSNQISLWSEETPLPRAKKDRKEAAREIRIKQAIERLGVTTLPAHHTRLIPLSSLLIEDLQPQDERRARLLAANVRAIGTILHPPIVEDVGSFYRVVSGRSRVLAARSLELPELECRVYPPLSPEQSRALSLSENLTRSPNRRLELEGVCRIVEQQAAVTEKELCAIFGLSLATARKYLKIANLPGSLKEEVMAGDLTLGLALQLTRLSSAQQLELAEQVQEGFSITSEQVHSLRYARASQNLHRLDEQFWEVKELSDRWLTESPAEVASKAGLMGCENQPPCQPELEFFRQALLQLKLLVEEQASNRAAQQIKFYVEAILSELGGLI